MTTGVDGLRHCVRSGGLVAPSSEDQITVKVQAHSIGSNRSEGIQSVTEREATLPAGREIHRRQRWIRRSFSPRKIDLAVSTNENRVASQAHVVEIAAGEGSRGGSRTV